MEKHYLESVIKQFEYYKMLGEKAIDKVPDDKLTWRSNEESNSIAIIVKHLSGNMLSRWTEFLTTDGEKSWRNRDTEFENDLSDRGAIGAAWKKGWACCLSALRSLSTSDLGKLIFIRSEGHTVIEAINRQLAHYAYHVGQIVVIAKMVSPEWTSLTIPKGTSKQYNESKMK